MGMSDGPNVQPPPRATMTATILGGRWDGHEVECVGQNVTYKDDDYILLRTDGGRLFYLLAAMAVGWFEVG
jgi:hypothetical protein